MKDKALRRAIEAARVAMQEEAWDTAWAELEPYRGSLSSSAVVAFFWAGLIRETNEGERHRDELEQILDAWPEHPPIVDVAAGALIGVVDGRPASDPIPDDDPTHRAIPALRRCLASLSERDAARPDIAGTLAVTLGNACRLGGTSYDAEAEAAYQRALALDPTQSWWRFDLGLLYKNRGRFHEGVELYRRVHAEVGDEESVLWNLGICATAVGDGEAAMFAWRRLGWEPEVGDDGLPRMGLNAVKVRLSTAKVGTNGDDATFYEHVWVTPWSPCHGVVDNPTLYDVGGDLGDIVVWDGQPIGYARRGEQRIPRFAALAWRGSTGARTFRFAVRFPRPDALESVRGAISDALRLYVFEEEIEDLCLECIRTGGPHEATHREPRPAAAANAVLHGKITVQPGRRLEDVWSSLDAATKRVSARLATPQLMEALGDDVGRRRHELLWTELDAE